MRPRRFNRREVVLGGTALAVAPLAAGCSTPPPAPGVFIGPFGADSTAEQVTAGIDLSGRNVLITGANSGLGYESMRVLAMRGAHVIATARTLEKAQAACATIEGRTTPLALELTDFGSVVQCATAVQALGVPLDVLIANAGVMEIPTLEQVNGIEKHFVTNHLGHFILTLRLLPQLQAAPQGRAVILSSGSSTRNAPAAGIEFDNLSGERDYDSRKAYGQSKLANALFARELARRLAGTRVTANAVQPGVVMTNLGRYLPDWQIWLSKVIGWSFMKSIGEGAATQCYVATCRELAGVSGQVFKDCNPILAGGRTQDDALAARLWKVSEELTKPFLM